MKKLLLAVLLTVSVLFLNTGCPSVSAPSTRVVEVQTLKSVAATAKAGINSAADAVVAGKMSVAHYQEVANFYDTKFQPAYNLAVQAVQSDLAPASPAVQQLVLQFVALIASYTVN